MYWNFLNLTIFAYLIILLTLDSAFASASASASSTHHEHTPRIEGILEGTKKVATTNTKFMNKFYTILRKTHKDNVIFSAFSVRTVVALLRLGAKGNTLKEIDRGMNFDFNEKTLKEGYGYILRKLELPNKPYILELANKIYAMKSFPIESTYSKTLNTYFKSDLTRIDFTKSVEAAKSINKWVEDKTHRKIQNIVTSNDFDSNSKLVLINAIYFNATWAQQFEEKDTDDQLFYPEVGKPFKVPTMDKTGKFHNGKIAELNCQVVVLPYKGDKAEMVILLPNKGSTLAQLERKLNGFDLTGNLKAFPSKVNLKLPKFKIESTIELKEPLIELGLQSMFDPSKADLSGISPSAREQNLFVTKAIQKAFIEVNERGTEASAATVMGVEGRAFEMNEPPDLFINRPFFYFILDKGTRCIFFSGSVTNPLNN